jgi:uncharacterized protein YecE (DUF72 family)
MDLFGEPSDLERATAIPNLYLGSQGWSYSSWTGPFYPPGLKPGEYLSEYAKHFISVELDTTFYAIPAPSLVDHWNRSTPDGFVFAAKFPKLITHDKRLADCDGEVAAFMSVMTRLGRKLGPLVLQFDHQFRFDQFESLTRFVEKLPAGSRYAVEVRHRDWLHEEFFAYLSEKNVSLVLADYSYMPKLDRPTANFVYMRWLGHRKDVPDDHYAKVIRDRVKDLDHWSKVVKGLLEKKLPVFGYFNNHYMGHSPESIRQFLIRMKTAMGGGDGR